MDELKHIRTLMLLVREETNRLERIFADDKPSTHNKRRAELRQAKAWLEEKVGELNGTGELTSELP